MMTVLAVALSRSRLTALRTGRGIHWYHANALEKAFHRRIRVSSRVRP